jgi:hypothetical protein
MTAERPVSSVVALNGTSILFGSTADGISTNNLGDRGETCCRLCCSQWQTMFYSSRLPIVSAPLIQMSTERPDASITSLTGTPCPAQVGRRWYQHNKPLIAHSDDYPFLSSTHHILSRSTASEISTIEPRRPQRNLLQTSPLSLAHPHSAQLERRWHQHNSLQVVAERTSSKTFSVVHPLSAYTKAADTTS